MFNLILVIATFISGVCWGLNKLIFYLVSRERLITTRSDTCDRVDKKISKKVAPQLFWIEKGASFFSTLATVLIIRSFIYEPFQIPSGSMMPTLLIGDFILVEKFSYGIKDPIYQRTLIKTGRPKRGDIVVFKYPYNPRLDYIKRVVGLPGDKITYDPIVKEITIQPKCSVDDFCKNVLPVTYSKAQPSSFVQIFSFNQENKVSISFLQIPKDNPKNKKENYFRLVERKETLGDITHCILHTPIAYDQSTEYYQQPGQKLASWIVPPKQYFMMGDNRDISLDSRYWGFVPETNLIGRASVIWMSLAKQNDTWMIKAHLNRIGKIH